MKIPTTCPFCDQYLTKNLYDLYIKCNYCLTKSHMPGPHYYKYWIFFDKLFNFPIRIHLATEQIKIIIETKRNFTTIRFISNANAFGDEHYIESIPDIDLTSKEDIFSKINLLATFV